MLSLKYKLLLLILPLCLIPLVGISVFSYFVAKNRITEDRVVLYLEQFAQDVADTIQLTLLEKKEETVSITLYGEFRDYLQGKSMQPPELLLNKIMLVHEVYDLVVLFDVEGRIVLMNTIGRGSRPEAIQYFNEEDLKSLRGESLLQFTPVDSPWLRQIRGSRFGYLGWHISPLVQRFYDYTNSDIAEQYSIGFAAPVLDDRNVVIGGVLAFMNWSFIQEILDKVEEDFEERSLPSGYAFLFGDDGNTIIGHKFRRNRSLPGKQPLDFPVISSNYGVRLVEDLGLTQLHEAATGRAPFLEYEYPPGVSKISGLASIDNEFFQWVCGVGVNDKDIFAPVVELRTIMIWAASLSIVLVVLLTYSLARRITIPLKRLTRGAQVIYRGDLSQRVEVTSRDEIGELAHTFNEMAASLEERSRDLLELNHRLEEKVRERTRELEESHRQVKAAYETLKQTQSQLVQSEKMASLGQLMAGIAHEIKNPLNFIYGNTEFLRDYVERLTQLVTLYEEHSRLAGEAQEKIEHFKADSNYEFLRKDLRTLIDNFEEGAKRIHAIVGDLRTFSRMDSEDFRPADLHRALDLALNLLQSEFRGRIRIQRDYGSIPMVECHVGRLSQVFTNLLLNAGQSISGEGEISIRTRQEGEGVVVEVQDSGLGISQEDRERIFEPFFTTKPVGQGTGLGLSISYAIIQQHRGTIEVESEPGRGSIFRIRIPVKKWKNDAKS